MKRGLYLGIASLALISNLSVAPVYCEENESSTQTELETIPLESSQTEEIVILEDTETSSDSSDESSSKESSSSSDTEETNPEDEIGTTQTESIIQTTDFSFFEGTWKSPNGDTIFFSKDGSTTDGGQLRLLEDKTYQLFFSNFGSISVQPISAGAHYRVDETEEMVSLTRLYFGSDGIPFFRVNSIEDEVPNFKLPKINEEVFMVEDPSTLPSELNETKASRQKQDTTDPSEEMIIKTFFSMLLPKTGEELGSALMTVGGIILGVVLIYLGIHRQH